MKKNLFFVFTMLCALSFFTAVVTMMTIRLMTAGRLFLRLIRQKH